MSILRFYSKDEIIDLRINEARAESTFADKLKIVRVKRAVKKAYLAALKKLDEDLQDNLKPNLPDPYEITKSVIEKLKV